MYVKLSLLIFFISLGCLLHAQPLTYLHDIKPIIEKNCVSCHRPGDIGPMPLTSYEEVSSYGQMIQYVTTSKLMPPWYADPSYSHFANERVLTQEEINQISQWVKDGMAEGAMPYGQIVSTTASVKVLPRKADLVIPMQKSFEQYGIYMDQYQVFVLPVDLEEDKWITGIEFVPGNKKIVRHASISIARQGAFDSLDRWDPRYGYYSFGGLGKMPDQPHWYTWSPQQGGAFYKDGKGKLLPKGSELIVHIHYGPTGTPLKDSSSVRLYFATDQVTKPIITSSLINPGELTNDSFYIEANTKKIFHAEHTLKEPISLMSLTPQANLICRAWEIFAEIPGQQIPVKLLKINDWNFNWKQTFRFPSSVQLPAGTVIHALAHYDNTLDNFCNPSDIPVDITWGPNLFQEQFYVHFEYTVDRD